MVAVVYDNSVKIPVDLSGKTGNISLPAWAAIQKELLSGSNDRKLLACRILSGDLKHHPESVNTVLTSASILTGLAQAATCGDFQVEREVCAVIRICCYEADVRAGEAVASSPPLLNGLCRLALNEDPFVVETLSQLSHNNPKVLWLVTTLLKVLRFQLKRDLKMAQRFFTTFRTEVELTRTKRKILAATSGARDPLPAMKNTLAYHLEDNWTVDRLCDVDEWIEPVMKAATVREPNFRNWAPHSPVDESFALPIKAATVREFKPREEPKLVHPLLTPQLTAGYRAPSKHRMVDVDVMADVPVAPVKTERICDVPVAPLKTERICDVPVAPLKTERVCDVDEFVPVKQLPVRAVSPARQTMCDVDVGQQNGRSTTPGRRTMVDVDVPVRWQSMVDVDVPGRQTVDYRMWQTGRSTMRGSTKTLREARSLSPSRAMQTSGAPAPQTEDSPTRKNRVVEVIPWHKSQRYIMAAMARSTSASTVRLTNHSSHQGVYRPRDYSTVQEQRQTLKGDKMCDVDEYLSYRTLSTVERVTTKPRLTADSDLYQTLSQLDRPKMADTTLPNVARSTLDRVMMLSPQEPSAAQDASVAFKPPLSRESSQVSTPRKNLAPGKVCDVEEFLPRGDRRRTSPEMEAVLDTTKPSMPIYSTVDDVYNNSINLYTTNPGEHPEPSDLDRANLKAFPSDWSEAIMMRNEDDDEERAWF